MRILLFLMGALCAAFFATAVFADGVTNVVTNANGVTNSFTRGGVSFSRRGALTSSDFVVTDATVYPDIYDAERRVTWRAVMHGGNLYYVAVTNANITATGAAQ